MAIKSSTTSSFKPVWTNTSYSGESLTLFATFDKTSKMMTYAIKSGTTTLKEGTTTFNTWDLDRMIINHTSTSTSDTKSTFTFESLTIKTTTSYCEDERIESALLDAGGTEENAWTAADTTDWVMTTSSYTTAYRKVNSDGILEFGGGSTKNGIGWECYHKESIPSTARILHANFIWTPQKVYTGGTCSLEFAGYNFKIESSKIGLIVYINGENLQNTEYVIGDQWDISMDIDLGNGLVEVSYGIKHENETSYYWDSFTDKIFDIKDLTSNLSKIVMKYNVYSTTTLETLKPSLVLLDSYSITYTNVTEYYVDHYDENDNELRTFDTMFGVYYSKIDTSLFNTEPIYTDDAAYTFKEFDDPDAMIETAYSVKAIYTKSTEATYTVKYYYGTTELKEAAERTGTIGTTVELDAADTQEIKVGDKTYVFDNTDAATQTIKSNGSTVVSVNFLEKTTAVEQISTDKKKGQIYSLDGRPVNRPNRKGLYVQDGKLVIM